MVRNFFPQEIHDNIAVNTNYPPQSSEDNPFTPAPGVLMQYEDLTTMLYEDSVQMEYEFEVIPDIEMQYEDLDIMDYENAITMTYEP